MAGNDLGSIATMVQDAIAKAGPPPTGTTVELRGQIPQCKKCSQGCRSGLLLAIAAVFLLLTANFQSIRLALAAVSTIPAVVAGCCDHALLDQHHREHSIVYRRDHGGGCCDGQRDLVGYLC